jgi:hypothetical protein
MKISVLRTVKEMVETEINLPYFCKENSRVYGVFTEDKCICVNSGDYTSIAKCTPSPFLSDIAVATPITFEEFHEAYEAALINITSVKKQLA